MSVKIMGLVWDADLPKDEKFILLAYADHADHTGRNVYPSVGLVAWKTGYSPRSVTRITHKLEERGIMLQTGRATHNVKKWQIVPSNLPERTDWRTHCAEVTACQDDNDDTPDLTNTTVYPDTVSPKSSLTINEPSDTLHDDSKKELSPAQLNFSALAKVCRFDLRLITKKQRGMLNVTEKALREGVGATPDQIAQFSEWWYNEYWKGKNGQAPAPSQVQEEWGQFRAWRDKAHSTTSRVIKVGR